MRTFFWQGNHVGVAAKGIIESHGVSQASPSFRGHRLGNINRYVGERNSGSSRRYGPVAVGRELSEVEKVRGEDRRKIDKSELLLEDPYGPVEGAMSTPVRQSH